MNLPISLKGHDTSIILESFTSSPKDPPRVWNLVFHEEHRMDSIRGQFGYAWSTFTIGFDTNQIKEFIIKLNEAFLKSIETKCNE